MKRILAPIFCLLLASTPSFADSLGSAVGGTAGNQSNMAGGLCITSPATLSNGQQRSLLVDCIGGALITEIVPTSAAAGGIAPIASTSAESCHVLKNSSGNLYSASGYIGAAGWIMVFNSISAPGDGAVTPAVWAFVPAAGSWSIDYGGVPASFSTGITVCASSTGPLTKTAYSTNTVFSGRVQ